MKHRHKLLSRSEKLQKASLVATIFILVVAAIIIYFSFFYFKPCNDSTCFLNYLENCDRATYSKDGELAVNYFIEGYSKGTCNVKIELVSLSGDYKLAGYYNASNMECKSELGSLTYPEKDISACSGLLKEGLQEILINRLKVEIVKNIGEINLNFLQN